MKRFYAIVIVICLFLLTSCSNRYDTAQVSPLLILESQTPTAPPTDVDKTPELKQKAYEALKGKGEGDFYAMDNTDTFNLAEFSSAVGCSCALSEDLTKIIIHPPRYNADEDFRVEILFDSAKKIITGDIIQVGRDGDGWEKTIEHNSATDFTTHAAVSDYRLIIGFDELDYLWRQIRLLTSPADKTAEIEAEIDAELQSYMAP